MSGRYHQTYIATTPPNRNNWPVHAWRPARNSTAKSLTSCKTLWRIKTHDYPSSLSSTAPSSPKSKRTNSKTSSPKSRKPAESSTASKSARTKTPPA